MGVMEKLKMFVVQEPVVAASCLIAGVGCSKLELDAQLCYFCFCSLRHLSQRCSSLWDVAHTATRDLLAGLALLAESLVEWVHRSVCVASRFFFCRHMTGLFLPAVVRPILDSLETSKQVPQPALSDVVAGMTGKKQE
ncbi:hypothetical protein HHK36_001313 [Tetracentron sinense]|uniref:Uncharacterized protein n=1 Tax=Tetracentron sinense TaxID=13715 RepID=A0A834ZT44_TETSI|nr:hypothetical protein HHK36_001313 [Tetracentron sinense]